MLAVSALGHGPDSTERSEILSIGELEEVLKPDKDGKATRKDKIMRFPEISTFTGFDTKKDEFKVGLGIELFHKRDRPRRHKWKFEAQFGEDYAGIAIGRIVIPVVNFTVGVFYGTDKRRGVYVGFYKF